MFGGYLWAKLATKLQALLRNRRVCCACLCLTESQTKKHDNYWTTLAIFANHKNFLGRSEMLFGRSTPGILLGRTLVRGDQLHHLSRKKGPFQ